ncbi:RDD family protein [Maritimibacter dapengensis]|uniref:RDD family protein n=1 Tax=Maritimibacter dapengensis TaxID=2836868 RepID=A0ABS6T294_9RHOB|nr:RDD family protein [Maritimibacter dapengensis]MBV7379378.1 RDD family protein [Maritimibacter dapengensis]
MDHSTTYAPGWGLPDPDYQSEFYADVPAKRAIAWVIDTLIVVFIVAIAIIATVGIGFFFAGFLWLVIGFIYRVVTLANGSATLGMRIASIELRRGDGTRFDLGTAIMHTLGYSLSMSFVLPQVASIILMLTNERGQGLTDLVLGTAAINRAARL